MIIAGLCTFIDENDRIFTPKIRDITAYEWGICVAVACVGKYSYSIQLSTPIESISQQILHKLTSSMILQ